MQVAHLPRSEAVKRSASNLGTEPIRRSAPDLGLPAPQRGLRASIVVPVKNEEVLLPRLVAALARQRALAGEPMEPRSFETILLLNNCRDNTARVARRLRQAFPCLTLHWAQIELAPAEAHVGRARQMLFDVAASRFRELERPRGIILTTDADTCPAPDWLAQTEREIASGVDGVGGRITLDPQELALLSAPVRRSFLFDIGYRRALEEMAFLYAPEAHDPFPRHHQHFAGCLAVSARAYDAAGGMPLVRSSEDVALYRAVLASGGKFRHSYRVRATTSARLIGRARGGLADALSWWEAQALQKSVVRVESASAAERRLATRGLVRFRSPEPSPRFELESPPEPPPADEAEPLEETLGRLRTRNAQLRTQSLSERLTAAIERFEIIRP